MTESKKSVFEMIRLGAILVCYAVASCTVLAIVNNFTSEKIRQNNIEKANAAMREVFADADAFEMVELPSGASSGSISVSDSYVAKKDGQIIGGVVQVAGPTYDKGKIIIGVRSNGQISGLRFLELTDSPGFGLKASDPTFKINGMTFYDQFEGKNALDGVEMGEDFDAISGATITSKAVGALADKGAEVIMTILGQSPAPEPVIQSEESDSVSSATEKSSSKEASNE